MTMPSSEPSPQILTERSASFNRAEFNKSARIKSSNTDFIVGDVESMENLTCTRASARHIRHSSLDSHPSALHPINLNSKFDHFCSFPSPAKASAKVSIVSDDQAEKESSFFSAPYVQKEGGGETQEELSLEPHEALLQDAPEESFSTSFSAGSKSPRENLDLILWGNAAFCLLDARDLSSCNSGSGLQRQSERISGESIKNHPQNFKQGSSSNTPELPSRDEVLLSLPGVQLSPDCGLAVSAINTLMTSSTMEASMAETEGSIQCQSSVGSTLSVHDSSTIRHMQAEHCKDLSKQKPLMSSEEQSCCLDFDAHEMEASMASDCEILADEVKKSENLSKGINAEEGRKERELTACTQEGSMSSSHLDSEVHQEGVLMAAEEVKIRAELELEIERDLEQEIKTKIYLLNRRLEELRVLKATRHPTQDQGGVQTEEDSALLINEKDEAGTASKKTKDASLPKSPPSKSPKKRSEIEQSKGVSQAEKMSVRLSVASSKKQLDKDVQPSHANTPLTSWRKYATASGWAPHTKENSSPLASSDGSLKNMKISKHSIEGQMVTTKPKVQIESTSSFKRDYQSWTGITSSKKFDWIRTLRSEVPSTPRVSSMKLEGAVAEETPLFIPSSKESLCGNVVRTLFTEDCLSTPGKALSSKVQRRESVMTSTPLARSSKRSMFSSSKTHSAHADAVVSTPRIHSTSSGLLKHDTASRSTSAKRLSQKPPSGIQARRDLQKSPAEPRQQARISASSTGKLSSISRVSLQQASSKAGKIERKSSVVAPGLTNKTGILKNASPTHAEKLKRFESAIPCGTAHRVSSKDIKVAPAKTPSKPSLLLQARTSRIAPSLKPVNSPALASKARIVPVDNLGRRQSSTPLKMTGGGASTREKLPSRH